MQMFNYGNYMVVFTFLSSRATLARPSRLRLWAFAIALGLSNAFAQATVPVAQTFFVPFPETDFQASLKAIDTTGTPVGNSLKTIISIVVPTAGTQIVYDHWEDGYEANPSNPVQTSTQIWGDGNPSNGSAPGYPSDILPAGAVITLNNNVAMPRAATTVLYDGRDRIGATKAVAVTRAGWGIAPGTVLASACEVYDTRKWGTSFKVPVGSNTTTQQQFEYSSLHIIASQDGTVVQVDKDGNGSIDVTRTLNLGDSMFVNGGILAGATVAASKPVEVHELTGDIGSSYESRTFAIRPTAQWASSYFAPVGTTLSSEVHNIYLYNPGASAITVSYETTTGSGTFSVPANGNYEFHMPMNSGGHFFTAGGSPFYAVGANDAGAAAGSNQTHDWGYALLPETALTTSIVASWAPGSDDLAAPLGVPDQNGSPVWITPSRSTTVYVNYSGDLTVGPNTAPDTSKYDVAYSINKLESKTIYNPTTKDLTKARFYTTDGTTIAGAWGEDPSKASAGAPCLDMGTTIIPFPLPVFTKTATLVNDLNSDGKIGTGDTVEYTLSLRNDGVVDLPNAIIEDTVPTGTTYVPGSTKLDSVAYPDDLSPATIFPLDNGGLTLSGVPSGNTLTLSFRVTINAGATNVTNTAAASSDGVPLPLSATVGFSVVAGPSSTACTVAFTNSSGTAASSYASGADIYVTVTDADSNTNPTTVQTMTAVVTNPATGDEELVTLTETGVNTGVFRNTVALPSSTTSGTGVQDGTLYAQPGQMLHVTHTDSANGDVCTNTAVISVPSQTKYLYLSDPSQALDRVDPVATSDATTASTPTIGGSSSDTIAVVAGTTTSSVTSATSLSFAHDPGTGSNRVLVVTVGLGAPQLNDTPAPGNITSVVYGSQTMTLAGSVTGAPTVTSIYTLVNPASGSHNVVISTDAAAGITAGATTYTGVSQTTPTGTFVSNSNTNNNTSISTTVASATGEVIVAAGTWDNGGNTQTITPGAGMSALWSQAINYVSAAGASIPGAASVSVTFDATNSQQSSIAAVPLKPATIAYPTITTFTQAPAMATAFTMPAGTAIGVVAYPSIISGSMPVSPTISAVLKKGATYAGATTITTIANPTYNGGAGTLTWTSAVLGSPVTVNAGEFIYLDISTTQAGVSFQIQYDSTSKPSKITLPTNTVISIPSYGLYDAAYPGGSLVTSIGNGQTVYVRASVTDPFGTYDISSLVAQVSDSGGPLLSVSASSVSDNGTTKIFEYPWLSGPNDGAYTIQVTGHEGTEGIQTTATLPIQVVSTDNGTPSTTTFTDSSGTKVSTYTTSGPVYVQVVDRDQNTNTSVAETVTAVVTTANGDQETITLTETGPNTGIFRSGPITTNTSTVTQGNNALNVVAGTGLHVVYIDPTDPSDTSSDNASIASPPAVPTVSAFKTLLTPADGTALVGDTVTYNIQVTNPGTVTLPTVSLSDTFPAAKLQYVSATVAPNTINSGSLAWTNVGPLTAGQSVSIQVSFTALAAGATVTNSASVGGTATFGPTTANVLIDNPKVTVTKTVLTPASGPAYMGDNLVYRLVIQNSGSTPLTTVPLQDQFPGASLEFVGATVSPNASGYGSLLWNNIGPIAVSNSVTIDVTFKVIAASSLADNEAIVNGAVDGPGNPVPPSRSTASLQLVAFNLSGHVYNDANGLKDSTVNGTGTNVGGALFANLLDDSNVVVQTVAVAANGSYSFSGLSHNTNYSVLVSTNEGTVGDFAPAMHLPVNWVSTGENIGSGTGDDGSPDAVLAVSIGSADVTDANFGIERAPASNDVTPAAQVNPGGTTRVAVPALTGTDPEDPSVTTFVILSLPADGILYYDGTAVTAGQRITSFNPALLTVDPANGSVTVSFAYLVEDAAGEPSAPSSVSMSFTAVNISGRVFNDANAMTDGFVNGSGTNAGGGLYAVLSAAGIITDSVAVASGGSFTFSTVAPNTSYVVTLATAPGTPGNAAPVASFPSGWIPTGEHLGSGAGNDGIVEGKLTIPVVTSSVIDADLGIRQMTSINGHLYVDTNGNGTQDGEPNLPNVDVIVTDQYGTTYTVTSDSSGAWTVSVPVGSNSIHVDTTDTDFPAGATQTEGTDPTVVNAVANASNFAGNDGYYIPATISGHLYVDINGNGTQDLGEPNLADVDVNITNSIGDPQTATTDASGNWTTQVPPGSTLVYVDQLDADFISNVSPGFIQTEGNDPTIFVAIANVTTDAGTDGYFIPGTVHGHLYIDTNGNGAQDVGEPNLPNVGVIVTDSNGVDQTVSTDFNGDWTASVPPGSTSAKIDPNNANFMLNVPAGYVLTEGTDPTVVIALADGSVSAGNDGFFLPAIVSGHLYVDTNGNGTQQVGEPNLPNVDVIVTDANNLPHTVTTDANGNWSLGVLPGITSAKVDTSDTDFINAVPVGYVRTEGDDPTVVTAVASTTTSAGNDGYFIPAILTGHLYVDSNGNHTQDVSEPNLVNVDVVVTDSNGSPQTVSTNSSGNWTASVPPGSTTIKVATTDSDFTSVLPAGYTQTEGDDPTTVIAVANVTTTGGADGYQPAALYSIGGQVRFDSDRNGSFLDADRPLPNFTAKLYADANGNGLYDPGVDTLLETQTTGADGNYKFVGYPNGNYIVVESPPNSSLTKTNDRDGNNDRNIPVVIADAGSNGNDFLEFADPQGWFYDTETGEVIPGGSVSVTTLPAGGAITVVLDGSNGEYSWLTNGVAGDYVMTVTVPAGYTLDPSRPVNPAALVPNGLPDPVTVGSNVNIAGTHLQDFSAGANTWYTTFTLQSGDPRVLYNNIPLLRTTCPVSFTGWKTRHPLGGQNGATDNPDGDDFTNLEEFAFCYDPSSGVNGGCPLDVVVNANGTIDAMVRRVIGAVGITYELEYISALSLSSANGGGWTTIQTISPMVMDNGDGTETAMYQNLAQIPALAAGKGFVRVKVTESSSGTAVRTHASGWSTRSLTTGCQSCGDPFLDCPVFTGTVNSAAGNIVDVTTAAGGESVKAQLISGKQYFIEVTSGDNAGQRWELNEASSGAATLVIDLSSPFNTLPTLPANLVGDHIAVRQHVTFKEVFPPAKFHATNAANTADRILVCSPGTGAYAIYWLFNNFGNPKWIDVANATFADVGVNVFDNSQGVYIHPKNAPATLVLSGQVRQNVFACPIKTGPNMITGGWPMDQSAASRALTVANGFTGGGNPLHADKVHFWAGDEIPNQEAYVAHFLLNAGGRKYLTVLSDATLINEDALPLFKSLRANFIQSMAGKSDWIMPLPWTP